MHCIKHTYILKLTLQNVFYKLSASEQKDALKMTENLTFADPCDTRAVVNWKHMGHCNKSHYTCMRIGQINHRTVTFPWWLYSKLCNTDL